VILQVTLKKGMELGASVAVMDEAAKTLGEVGNGSAINAATGFAPATVINAAGQMTKGFAADSYGLKFGFVGQNGSAFIRALETKAETKVIAAPRLLVLNKQQANVQVGDQLGFQNETTTQTSTSQSFQSIPVGTILSLRPFISSDGMIRMDVSPQRATGHIEAGIPQTNTTQVSTNVMIPDGQTIVIGGLIDSEVTSSWEGFPFLSRIPFLGYLFRHSNDSLLKKELIVLLTARIVRPEAPDALNYIGAPKTLGMRERLSQTPQAEAQDGPTLYELARPDTCPPGNSDGTPLRPMAHRAVERR
jgi:general secretion pathway protein D